MTQTTLPPLRTTLNIQYPALVQSNRWASQILFLAWGLLALQGLFYGIVTDWVMNRSFILFTLLPFNLYPTDLLLLPILLLAMLFAVTSLSRSRSRMATNVIPIGIVSLVQIALVFAGRVVAPAPLLGPILWTDLLLLPGLAGALLTVSAMQKLNLKTSGRRELLLGWWLVMLVGVILGILNQNPGVTGDIRELMIRPLVAVGVFFLTLLADLPLVFRWIVRFGTVLAIYLLLASILHFAGISVLPAAALYGGIPLLLPYAYVLAQVIFAPDNQVMRRITLGVMALAIVITLAKPLIAAFIACNALVFLLAGRASLGSISGRRIGILISLAVTIMLATVVLMASGGFDNAIDFVSRTYLKEGAATQDLSGSRFSIWQLGLETWRERPIQGHGLGYVLSGMVLNLRLGELLQREIVAPHNFIIEMMYKVGGIGALALLLLGVFWLRSSIIALRSHKEFQLAIIHLAAIVSVLTVLVLAMYGSHMTSSVGGFLLWFSLGVEAVLATNLTEKETLVGRQSAV